MMHLILFIVSLLTTVLVNANEVAITMDDFAMGNDVLLRFEERDQRILKAFKDHKVQAALFVTGKYLKNRRSRLRLDHWDQAGHIIANHTVNHWYYHKTPFKKFSQDILDNERLIGHYSHFERLFRFPFLKAGKNTQQRDQMRHFLQKHGYKNGYVTIDGSDWYISDKLRKAYTANPRLDLTPYRDYYLQHVWHRTQYYDNLARRVFKRPIKHNLLVHHNLLNGLFMADVLSMYKKKGWKIIDAKEAFADPIYDLKPNVVPAGESIVWSMAKASKKFENELRYPAEDATYEKAEMKKLGL